MPGRHAGSLLQSRSKNGNLMFCRMPKIKYARQLFQSTLEIYLFKYQANKSHIQTRDYIMKMKKIRQKAEKLGLEINNIKKVDLIRNIQTKEKNAPCFRTGNNSCEQFDCCWRNDCVPTSGDKKTERTHRESYLHQIKDDLEAFKDNIDALKMKTKKVVKKNKTEVLEEMKNLEKKSEEEIKIIIQALSEASENAWKSTKKGVDSSWEDLRGSFKSLMSKL
jgi:hypothetical protein